jgi:hypothetical protein
MMPKDIYDKLTPSQIDELKKISLMDETMESYENTFGKKSSEEYIKKHLIDIGYIEKKNQNIIERDKKHRKTKIYHYTINKTIKGFTFNEEYKNDKFFMYQPFGSQGSPDFLICIFGFICLLEDKGTTKTSIMWNGHNPKRDYLYFISQNTKHYLTFSFYRERKNVEDFKKALKELVANFNKNEDNLSNDLPILDFYGRLAFKATNINDVKKHFVLLKDFLKEKENESIIPNN